MLAGDFKVFAKVIFEPIISALIEHNDLHMLSRAK